MVGHFQAVQRLHHVQPFYLSSSIFCRSAIIWYSANISQFRDYLSFNNYLEFSHYPEFSHYLDLSHYLQFCMRLFLLYLSIPLMMKLFKLEKKMTVSERLIVDKYIQTTAIFCMDDSFLMITFNL